VAVFEELNLHERGGVAYRERAEDDGVEHLVDGGVGADAEREGQDGGGGEPGIVAELAERVGEVLGERIEEREAALAAIGFVELGDGTELAAGGGEGIGGGEAAAFVIGGEESEGGGGFGGEFGRGG